MTRLLVAWMMLFMVLTPTSPFLERQAAEAAVGCPQCATEPTQITGIAKDAANFVEQSLWEAVKIAAQTLIADLSRADNWKEFFLDAAVWFIKEILIRQLMSDILTWINSGFDDSPMFVRDLSGFMTDVADKAAGHVIDEGFGLGFLCSEFTVDIQFALDTIYRNSKLQNKGQACTLSGVVNNIDNFISGGDFTEGGWQGWFDYSLNPSNNLYGSYLEAEAIARISVRNAKGEQATLLNWNSGFFSSVFCPSGGDDDGSGGVGPVDASGSSDCLIETPGKVVAEATTFQVTETTTLTLIEADEFNEILTAALIQVAKLALGSNSSDAGPYGQKGLYSYWQDGHAEALKDTPAANCNAPEMQTSITGDVDTIDNLSNSIGTLGQEVGETITDYNTFTNDILAVISAEPFLDINNSNLSSCSFIVNSMPSGDPTYSNLDELIRISESEIDNTSEQSLNSIITLLNNEQSTLNTKANELQDLLEEGENICAAAQNISIDESTDSIWNISYIGAGFTGQGDAGGNGFDTIDAADVERIEGQVTTAVNASMHEFSTKGQDYWGGFDTTPGCRDQILNLCDAEVQGYIDDPDNRDADGDPPSEADAQAAVWSTDGCSAVANNGVDVIGNHGSPLTNFSL